MQKFKFIHSNCHGISREVTWIPSSHSRWQPLVYGRHVAWIKALRHTRHKTGHFRDVLPSQSLGIVLKKLNPKQQKHTYANYNTNYNPQKLNLTQINCNTQYHHNITSLLRQGGMHSSIFLCLSQARTNWEGCGRKGIRHKNRGGLMEVDCWLVQMEWHPPGCLPLVILPSTTKSIRSCLLALAQPGGHEKGP